MRSDELLNIIDLVNFYINKYDDAGLKRNISDFCDKTLKAQGVQRH